MSTSFIALDECQSSTVKSSKNTTISSRSQKQQTTRETQNKSAIFLPKLPAKLFDKRLKETHFISGFYVEPTNQQLQVRAILITYFSTILNIYMLLLTFTMSNSRNRLNSYLFIYKFI